MKSSPKANHRPYKMMDGMLQDDDYRMATSLATNEQNACIQLIKENQIPCAPV